MFPFNVEMDSIKFAFLGVLNDNNTAAGLEHADARARAGG